MTQVAPMSALAKAIDPGLLGAVAEMVRECRARRCELSMILAEIDPNQHETLVHGAGAAVAKLQSHARAIDHPEKALLEIGERQYALLLPDCDRRLAVQYGRELARSFSVARVVEEDEPASPLTLSVGVATVSVPPKNFPPEDLVDAAQRCLFGAQASGGNSVKSIEIY
jgi:GGDEF domain-containing protein